ncbi:hypothetical protein FNF31_07066 [Cafeteria roenbergensis]|uniref:U6 snRNA-associated Sm-like protein LSm1 n=2 Tax=Cafeteria roenbergensis TaxID=33653 RepID=A0A5A8CBN6_CAFRO|nr:hypothetical protein FNF31_07066 [Cafeteria roenbergensis]KAA0161852.1 hypothetical protein FNF28_04917 [Cafeteria roenbergensis]
MAARLGAETAYDVDYAGTASLCNEVGKTCMVVLTDGRHLIGTLSSYDQFASVVLEKAVERHHAAGKYADTPVGTFVVRGENIVLIAELDEAKEKAHPALEKASMDEVLLAESEAAT